MTARRASLLALLCAAIGCGDDGGAAVDAGPDALACDDDCVPGWWTVVTGGCSTLCSLDPQPRECAATDCEQLEAHEFQVGGVHSYLWMTHSPSAREFTLIAIYPEDTWSLVAECELSIAGAAASPFTCVGDTEMQFSTRVFVRPSTQLETALVDARAQGQGEYSY